MPDPERLKRDAIALYEAFKRGLSPTPEVTVSEWADGNRVLDKKSSNEAGDWQTDRTPYLREIQDHLSAYSAVQRIILMKGAQIGGSEMGLNLIGYVMDVSPCPVILVQPTGTMAERYSKSRLAPMISLCESLRKKLGGKAKAPGQTLTVKEFPGGILVMASANSAAELRSMPAMIVIFEEPDAYPLDVEEEGSPIKLAEARTSSYGPRQKVVMNCTPTMQATSVIWKEYLAGSQSHFMMPCPHDPSHRTVFHKEHFRFTPRKPKTAHFVCMGCGKPIEEGRHKTMMMAAAEWVPQAKDYDETVRSYYLPSSYSPLGWKSWEKIAKETEAAEGIFASQKALMNTVWGLPYRDATDTPDVATLIERARLSEWRTRQVPPWVMFLTGGVDIGTDHIEIGVWGWGRRGRRHLVEQIRVRGSYKDPEVWMRAETALQRRYLHPSGAYLQLRRVMVDRGFAPDIVDPWVRRQDPGFITAVKGHDSTDFITKDAKKYQRDAFGIPIKNDTAMRYSLLGVSLIKMELYSSLNLPWNGIGAEPAGWVGFPNDIPRAWMEQLVGEEYTVKVDQYGRGKGTWRKIHLATRVEALDCAVYARAAAYDEGWDEWTEGTFVREERRLAEEANRLAVAMDRKARERLVGGDRTPVAPADVGVHDIVLPGRWQEAETYGIAVIDDEETMQEQVDKVVEAVAAKAEIPIHDEPAPPTAPAVPHPAAAEPVVEGLKSGGWGGHDASRGIQREAAPGLATKGGWGGGSVVIPRVGSWADADDED